MTDRDRTPTSSADLVPQGLPHGSRQNIVALRQQAGVPGASRDLPDPTQLRAQQLGAVGRIGDANAFRAVNPQFDPLTQLSPDQVPGLFQNDPTRNLTSRGATPQTLADRIEQMGAQSNNRFMQAVAQRMKLRTR